MRSASTPGELYDLLHDLFGVGDYDEDLSPLPWWRFRALEVSKIKRSIASKRHNIEMLAITAHYCKAHGIDVRAVTWLYRHTSDALRWNNVRSRQEKSRELDELIADAVAEEYSHPDSPWLDRLVRARGPHRQEVYDQWKQQRSQTSGSHPSSLSVAPEPGSRRASSA